MAYVLTLQPTFTQGFIIGQLSILILLALILKYLFLDSSNEPLTPGLLVPSKTLQDSTVTLESSDIELPLPEGLESTEWFNLIIREVFTNDAKPKTTTNNHFRRYLAVIEPRFGTTQRVWLETKSPARVLRDG